MSATVLLAVMLLSAALAAVMSVIAWRVSRDERRRAGARIASLAAEIHTGQASPSPAAVARPALDGPGERSHADRSVFSVEDLPMRPSAARGTELRQPFRSLPAASSRPGAGTPALIGLFVFSCLAAAAIWLSPGTPTAPSGTVEAAGSIGAATAPEPLELIALGHEREGDRLTIRGTIRHPAAPGALDGVAAVVFVFDRKGAFLSSARAALPAALEPRQESIFAVTIPGITEVGSYRVSFRAAERVVPHVDKRGPQAGASAPLREPAAAAGEAR